MVISLWTVDLTTVLKGWLVLPTKHRGAVIRLIEKIHALDKLPSGRAYRATGCKFAADESRIYIK